MANEFGITNAGFNMKRMDTILKEIHGDLSEGYGFDTATKRDSVINVIAVSMANQIAQLWEVAQDSYYSRYPFSATGVSLDNACQYGGVTRKEAKPSYYNLHCTGDDGTVIKEGTIVATYTKPEKRFLATKEFTLTREKFNSIIIGVATIEDSVFTVALNGKEYLFFSSGNMPEESEIVKGLANAIKDDTFTVTVVDNTLAISCNDNEASYSIGLSENLMVKSVTTIGEFQTEEDGSIHVANRIITEIITATNGFDEVTNLIEPELGNDYETDIEFRQSYLAKCAMRSSSNLDSICAAILQNVSGVKSANGYENETDETDENGLPPHSIEIIVDGGDGKEIANQIHLYRTAGIPTYGSESYEVEALYGNTVTINFNRPEYIYAWFKVTVTGEDMPENYTSLVQESLLAYVGDLKAGETMNIQRPLGTIYDNINGVTHVDIKAYGTTDSGYTPTEDDYAISNIKATKRQKVVTAIDFMEVS